MDYFHYPLFLTLEENEDCYDSYVISSRLFEPEDDTPPLSPSYTGPSAPLHILFREGRPPSL